MKKILLIIFLISCSSNANSEFAGWSNMNQSVTYLLSNGYKITEITEVSISNTYTRYHYHLSPISSQGDDDRPVICNVELFFDKDTYHLQTGLTECYLERPIQ